MNNSMNTRKPFAMSIEEVEAVVLETRPLLVRGASLEVEEFSDGYIGITNPAFDGEVAGVERFHYTDHTRGLFTALASVKDNPKGDFYHGFHCAEGLKSVLLTRDEKKDYRGRRVARAYVNFSDLHNPMHEEANAGIITMLAKYGITRREDNEGYWVVIGAKDNAIYPMYTNIPMTWDEFEAYMAENHSDIEPGTPEWKEKVEDIYDHKWNISHKHEGIETVLHLIAGTTRVGVKFRPFRTDSNPERTLTDWDKMIAKHYLGLFTLTAEERRERKEKDNEQGEEYRKLRRGVINAVTNPNYQHSELIKPGKKGKSVRVEIFAAPGETKEVDPATLVGKTFQFVYGNGNTVKGATLPMPTLEHVLGAVDMAAQKYHALIRVNES